MSRGIVVIGSGGHAKVVISTLHAAGLTVSAAYDDNADRWNELVMGIPVRGPVSLLEHEHNQPAIIAIGSNTVRQRLANELKLKWMSVVHPAAYVHTSVVIEPGTVVFAGAVVQPESALGAHVIVNTGATIDHDCSIGDFVHVAPGVHLAGGIEIQDGAFLGVASVVIPGITVGAWSTVGAGGVVVRDVPGRTTVVGVPAKPLVAKQT